ncbi:O-antigen ligase family protein [Pontibacter populi]|nr:O-antigen ligase family protein [Pontibacter populi]
MKINKAYLLTIIFFFFNSFLLPIGLLYTTILTPVFYFALLFKQYKYILLKYVFCIAPFVLIHLKNGVVLQDYFVSLTLYFTVYIFIFIVYDFLKTRTYLDILFDRITNINFALTILALISLFTPFKTLWALHAVSAGISGLPRLSLFTYEPSYYSTLLVPLIFYYLLSISIHRENQKLPKLLMLGLSLCLSFSLGVIASIAIAISFVLLLNLHRLKIRRETVSLLLYLLLLGVLIALLLFIFYPENALYKRIYNVFTGNDSSGKGRTFEAIEIAYILIQKKSVMWGIGLGQIKTLGYDVITSFYKYDRNLIKVVTIPNAFAETLAIFGFVGAFLRIFLQLFLFFKTKVYKNYFQMLCFSYIFIYQFTGSFITNIAEYLIWLLAFIPYFTQFNKDNLFKTASSLNGQ